MIQQMRLALAGLVLIAGAGLAQDKPKDKPEPKEVKAPEALIGKWATEIATENQVKVKVVVEFKKDGKVELTADNKVVKGSYKFTAAETMEVEYGSGDTITKEELKVKINGDKLVLTGKSKPQEFERVK